MQGAACRTASRMNQTMRSITYLLAATILLTLSACTSKPPDYGTEPTIFLPGTAISPVNLSTDGATSIKKPSSGK